MVKRGVPAYLAGQVVILGRLARLVFDLRVARVVQRVVPVDSCATAGHAVAQ